MNENLKSEIKQSHSIINGIKHEIKKVLIGNDHLIDALLVGLLTKGHLLIEGVPGLAKTSAVKALSETVKARFKRIQFTPDLLPADIIGTEVYLPKTGEFTVKKGPLFHNIILADEINRAPSKVQAALLEAMQEKQVTIGDTTFPLPDPFLVLATQNPIEQEGTYLLPEAQIDRFMLKIRINYPNRNEELDILNRVGFNEFEKIVPVISPPEIESLSALISKIFVDDRLKEYMIDIVTASRHPDQAGLDIGYYIRFGASPRATIYLSLAARAHAFLEGREYVIPEDIKKMALDILRHRILLTYEAEAENISADDVIKNILSSIKIP